MKQVFTHKMEQPSVIKKLVLKNSEKKVSNLPRDLDGAWTTFLVIITLGYYYYYYQGEQPFTIKWDNHGYITKLVAKGHGFGQLFCKPFGTTMDNFSL